jgi:tetratricopeptide (TPR) repeat protein
MKQPKSIIFILLSFISLTISAQQALITQATELITAQKFAAADKYLDSILKVEPKNPDALMMKGNVLLNHTWVYGSKYFNKDRAENILDTALINESFFVAVVSKDTSIKIEKYWKQVLEIAPGKVDILKGLCALYSYSLRTDDLIAQIKVLKSQLPNNTDQAYITGDYARNLKVRGRFDDAMKVYTAIAAMYPTLAGIRCDIAGEYYYAGKPKEALVYLDSCLAQKDVDETSYINAAAIYSSLGYYDMAYKTFTAYSVRYGQKMAMFYAGLQQFSRMDAAYTTTLKGFGGSVNQDMYADEVPLAARLIALDNRMSEPEYQKLVKENYRDYYSILIHQRAMMELKESCSGFLGFGFQQLTFKNYEIANEFFEDLDQCKLDSAQLEAYSFYYAYSLYKVGKIKEAGKYFRSLMESTNDYRRSAAIYFMLEIAKNNKTTDQAKIAAKAKAVKKLPNKFAQLL